MAASAKGSIAPPSSRVESAWQGLHRARLSARAPRYLATAVLVLFFGLGIRSVVVSPSPAVGPHPVAATADAPSQDFALQFARAYLTYDAERPGDRARALAPFLSDQLAAGAGFTPVRGTQKVIWVQVASDQPALAGGRVITVASQVSTQRLPLYLAVTVEHPAGEPLALAGYPSIVGAPAVGPAAPPVRSAVDDPAVLDVVDRVLRNYLSASAPNLEADLADGAAVTLPTVALRVQSVDQVAWIAEPGSGAVLATVTATGPRRETYTLAYELGLAYRERPYVDFIETVPTAG